MIAMLITSGVLMALCVCIHAGGVAFAGRRLRGASRVTFGYWSRAAFYVRLAGFFITLHLIEIFAWGAFFAWRDVLPDLTTALYFSAATYTTTGYGDVTLPEGWRLLAGVEALTGILMCGWSAAFFFSVINQVDARRGNE